MTLVAHITKANETAPVLSILGVFFQFFSVGNLPLLTIGKFFTGVPLGVFITIAPTYCCEIAPVELRGAVTAAVNWSIVLGQCLAYVVLRQTQSLAGSNSYRVLFAIQWVFAGLALVALPFFPESPYHLVARGDLTKARTNTYKLHDASFDADSYLIVIAQDLDTSSRLAAEEPSFKECFKGTNKQRTFIAMSTFVVQAVCGISWMIG